MTLGVTLALVTAACAAAHGCTVCIEYQQSEFEHECQQRGGSVRTLGASRQWCVMDAGQGVEARAVEEDGG